MLLDEALPRWDNREVHDIATDAPAQDLLRAFDELTWREVPAFKALMSIRGLARGRGSDARVYEWFESSGFVELARTESEILVAAVEPVGRRRLEPPTSVKGFRDLVEPGFVKIATTFVVRPGRMVTETRVVATDARARRRFAAYWLVIRPFSGLIRRVWLRAIAARASKVPAGGR